MSKNYEIHKDKTGSQAVSSVAAGVTCQLRGVVILPGAFISKNNIEI